MNGYRRNTPENYTLSALKRDRKLSISHLYRDEKLHFWTIDTDLIHYIFVTWVCIDTTFSYCKKNIYNFSALRFSSTCQKKNLILVVACDNRDVLIGHYSTQVMDTNVQSKEFDDDFDNLLNETYESVKNSFENTSTVVSELDDGNDDIFGHYSTQAMDTNVQSCELEDGCDNLLNECFENTSMAVNTNVATNEFDDGCDSLLNESYESVKNMVEKKHPLYQKICCIWLETQKKR